MNPATRNLLYREPRLYDLVFPDADGVIPNMCREAFRRYRTVAPDSVLDVGCGTGLHLEAVSKFVDDCRGVDCLDSMIEYARQVRPHLELRVADMREVRLGRTFDVITSFGNAISYALTDDDLDRTAATFGAHAHQGTLLILDFLNARSYLDGDGFKERIESEVHASGFSATAVSIHELDRATRRLTRVRTWTIPGRGVVKDHAEYRLIHPEEIKALLERHGFDVKDMFDNREFKASTLAGKAGAQDPSGMRGRKLYVFAVFG